MRVAGDFYEASVVPRGRSARPGKRHRWLHAPWNGAEPQPQDPVVADIVVIDLRSGAERVEISVTGAQVSSTLAKVHRDLDTLSVETFDEQWGVL